MPNTEHLVKIFELKWELSYDYISLMSISLGDCKFLESWNFVSLYNIQHSSWHEWMNKVYGLYLNIYLLYKWTQSFSFVEWMIILYSTKNPEASLLLSSELSKAEDKMSTKTLHLPAASQFSREGRDRTDWLTSHIQERMKQGVFLLLRLGD